MIGISEQVVSLLKSEQQITSVVGDRIYPMIGNENAKFPFVTYNVGDEQEITKDAFAYPVNVLVWFEANQKTKAVEMRGFLKEMILQSDYEFENTMAGMQDETGHVFAELNFKIIK